MLDRLQGGKEALADEGVRLHAITDMNTALSVAEADGLLSADELAAVREYLKDAEGWHHNRGLPFIA